MERGQQSPSNVLVWLVFWVGAANFMAFIAVSHYLGGDAINGALQGGKYFLGSHGRLTEVSENAFTYSLWHARSLLISHLAAVWAAMVLGIRKLDERA